MTENREPEPLCVSGEVIQSAVDKAISQFDGKAERIILPMDLFNAYQLNAHVSGFRLKQDIKIVGSSATSEIQII